MLEKFNKLKFAPSLLINLLFFIITTGKAQDSVTIVSQDLTNGVTIELNTSVLASATNFIVIGDSGDQKLALSGLTLNDQNIRIKKSSEAANIENTAHWFYNDNPQFLYIDLNGIKNSFSSDTNLRFSIIPVKINKTNFSLSISESSTDSGNLPDGLQKITDLKVDLK